jgi:hypothetical protein
MSLRSIKLLHRFVPPQGGNVAVAFALIPIIAFVGATVEYSRANAVKTTMSSALEFVGPILQRTEPTPTLRTDQLQSNLNYKYQQAISLMTDGRYTQDVWYTRQSQIDARQEITCDNNKIAGVMLYPIQVYTVGDPTSILLQNCVTNTPGSTDHYFLRKSENEIVTTFNRISKNFGATVSYEIKDFISRGLAFARSEMDHKAIRRRAPATSALPY